LSKKIFYHNLLIKPIVTEKSNLVGGLTFEVDKRYGKNEIRAAVESVFEVKVSAVRTLNIKGKSARMGKSVGTRKSIKKAYITLVAGEKISLFEGL
jgi:large subunit ribosomal protein L23